MSYVGFKGLQDKLTKGDVADPAALAASIGRRKYGSKAMGQAAASGTSLRGHKKAVKHGPRHKMLAQFVKRHG